MKEHQSSLLDDLELDEKVSLVHGGIDPAGTATGYLPGVDRLDIPPLRLVDGPIGVRIPDRQATHFLSLLHLQRHSIREPVRELAGFTATRIPAGESVTVDIDLHEQVFARYGADGWQEREGPFVVDVAHSVTDLRTSVELYGRS